MSQELVSAMAIFYLRIACLCLWAAAAIALAPSAWRIVVGRATTVDEYRTACFFAALLFIGQIGRWLLVPGDTHIFTGLYALTAALAVYVLILSVQGRRR